MGGGTTRLVRYAKKAFEFGKNKNVFGLASEAEVAGSLARVR